MPRQSAEATSAAMFRAGGRHPEPPKGMPKAAAELWREIVEARALDYFRPGSLQLLESFCRLTIVQRKQLRVVERDPADDAALGRVTKTSAALATLATKLRLSIQAETGRHGLERGVGKIHETGPKPSALLGGHAVEVRGRH